MNPWNFFFFFFTVFTCSVSTYSFQGNIHSLRICRICLRFKFPLHLKTEIKEKEKNL